MVPFFVLKIRGPVPLKISNVSYFKLRPKLFFLYFYFLGPSTHFRNSVIHQIFFGGPAQVFEFFQF